jgi:hypothetical protein
MALSKDDKEFIALSLKPLAVSLIGVNQRLDKINGSVQKHESQIDAALIERGGNRQHQKGVAADVDELKKKFTKVDDLLLEYKFARKYPRFMAAAVTVFGILSIITALYAFGAF